MILTLGDPVVVVRITLIGNHIINHISNIHTHQLTLLTIQILSQLHSQNRKPPSGLHQVQTMTTTNIASRLGRILHQEYMTSSHMMEGQGRHHNVPVHCVQRIRYAIQFNVLMDFYNRASCR